MASISSIALRRSATSVSRAVNTFSSAATALARASSASAWASDWALDCSGDGDGALLLGQLQGLAALDLQALDLLLLVDAVALQLEVGRDARALDLVAGGDLGLLGLLLLLGALARDLGALPGAAHLELALLLEPGALRWPGRCRGDASRPPDSCCGSAIIVSCSMSLRIFLRRSICSVSRVRPSASKALEGLKNSMLVWSRLVSETDLQLQPVLQQILGRPPAAPASRIRRASRAVSSMVISAATERSASTNLPSISSLRASGCMVRWPRVWAALAMASGVAWTRTIELGDDIDPHAVLGDERPLAPALHLQAQRVHVDRDDLMDDGQHEGAAVHHHLLAAEAGAHEGRLLGGPAIEPVQQPDDDGDDDRHDDDQAR